MGATAAYKYTDGYGLGWDGDDDDDFMMML